MKSELPKLADYNDKHGAGVLAAHIEAFWKSKGYHGIVAKRYEVPYSPGHYGVWSNMINGLPPRVPVFAT